MNTKTQKAVDNARELVRLADLADAAELEVSTLEAQLAEAKVKRDRAVQAVETYAEKRS